MEKELGFRNLQEKLENEILFRKFRFFEKNLLLCWSVSVPQSRGKATFDPVGEVKVIVSVLHKPAEFGCLKTNASKSSLTWQTAEISYK